MKPAESLDKLNKGISKRVLNLVGKKRPSKMADEYRGLLGPFMTIGGKLVCLVILIPTAIMEGVYLGIKHAASVLDKGM